MKSPQTGKHVSRLNPPGDWIVTEVPELRIVDDELWQAAKKRQESIAVEYAGVIEAIRSAINVLLLPPKSLTGPRGFA